MVKNDVSTVGSDFSDHLTENLRDPRAAAAYLMVSLEDADVNYFKKALGNVARAYGIENISKITEIPRATLYNILKMESNPSWSTIIDVLQACGLEIVVVPKEKSGLEEIVGGKPLPRTEVVKRLWEYIRKNNLTQDVLKVGERELDQLLKATHGLVRKVRTLPRAPAPRATKKRI